jgi:threonylcarbamoyladenosine tRNA methylthiotransferase MtaB
VASAFTPSGRVALVTQGCKVNQYDTQVLLAGFLSRGWELVPFGEPAELTVINSCTVTAGADADLRRLVARARRASASGRVLLTGCRAEVDPAGSAALADVDLVVGNRGKSALFAALAGEAAPAAFPDRVTDEAITRFDGRGRAILKIQDGCNLRCSFCIVPAARGASRSRSAAETIARARLLAEHGYRELVLSGIQLGFYRDPDGEAASLAALLEQLLAAVPGLRFRLGSLLPRHVGPALRALLRAEPRRLCPHLHISLQSGDDGVLRAMKRPYRAAQVRELLLGLAAELPDPCLGTDLIVGHPGEDAAAFERGLEFVAALPLSYGHVFPYSARPGTRAAAMGGGASAAEKAARSLELRSLLAAKGETYRARQQGRHLAVVLETAAEGLWQGTSENYQRVRVPAPGGAAGELLEVQVTGRQGTALTARRLAASAAEGASRR